jgi:hypothetical protein
VEFRPGGGDFQGLSCLQHLGKDSVAIIFVQYENVLVATRGLDWEAAGLIGVRFIDIQGGHEEGKDIVGGFVLGLLQWVNVKGRCKWEGNSGFGGLQIFLLHAQMSFAGGAGFGKMLFDQRFAEAGPGAQRKVNVDGLKAQPCRKAANSLFVLLSRIMLLAWWDF